MRAHDRSIALAAALAGVVALVVLLAACSVPAPPAGPLKGRAVGELQLTDAQGRPVALNQVARGKAALVDYWATWCAPCIAAMPHLDELHKKFGDRGFTVVGVMIDANATRVGPEWVRKKGLSYPNLFDDDGASSAKVLGPITGVPFLILLNGQGAVVEVFQGYTDPADIDKAVEALVGGGGAAPAA